MTVPITFDGSESRELFELWFGHLLATGERVVRKVSRGGAVAERLLRNEVSAGDRLLRRPGESYPEQLCRLVEHDLHIEAPFVTTTHRGWPVGRREDLPRLETVLAVYGDLLRGIQALARAGLTHGAITPEAVLWDGRHAQLVDFGQATPIGEPYAASLPPHWLPPPGNGSRLLAHPGHDVYQAGLVVHGMATGTPAADAPTMRARLREKTDTVLGADGVLGVLLADVFADEPALRPAVDQLLRRIDEVSATTVRRNPSTASTFFPGGAPPSPPPPPPTAPQPIPQQTVPLTPARVAFRHKVAAKRAYRERQARPAAAAWRFAVDLLDVLWHRQGSPRGKIALVVAVGGVVSVPVVMVVAFFAWLLGGTS